MAMIILGLSYPSLYFVRELGSKGYSIHCIGFDKHEICMYSRYGEKYLVKNIGEIKEIVKKIKKQNREVTAIICGGYYLDLILKEYPEFFKEVNAFEENVELLRLLSAKTVLYDELKENNMVIPKTYTFEEFASIYSEEEIKYPVIIKWSSKKYYNSVIGKTRTINNVKEFEDFICSSNLEKIKNDLLVQDFINDENFNELGYGAFYRDGLEVRGIIFEQKRQYPKGFASCAIEIEKELVFKVHNEIKEFLKKKHYNGFIQFDFMYNFATDAYYILDVNSRVWGCVTILGQKYPNLIKYILGEITEIEINESQKKGHKKACFVRIFHDITATLINCRTSKSLKPIYNTISDYTKNNCKMNEFDIKDIRPLIVYIGQGFRLMFKMKKGK